MIPYNHRVSNPADKPPVPDAPAPAPADSPPPPPAPNGAREYLELRAKLGPARIEELDRRGSSWDEGKRLKAMRSWVDIDGRTAKIRADREAKQASKAAGKAAKNDAPPIVGKVVSLPKLPAGGAPGGAPGASAKPSGSQDDEPVKPFRSTESKADTYHRAQVRMGNVGASLRQPLGNGIRALQGIAVRAQLIPPVPKVMIEHQCYSKTGEAITKAMLLEDALAQSIGEVIGYFSPEGTTVNPVAGSFMGVVGVVMAYGAVLSGSLAPRETKRQDDAPPVKPNGSHGPNGAHGPS